MGDRTAGHVRRGLWTLLLAACAPAGGTPGTDAPDAHAVVDRAYELMGAEALDRVQRVRLDMMTQWQRTGYRDVPWTDRPSFEPHVDVRDYTIPAWRNTRDFGARKITNVIRDTVATTDFGQGTQPLSIAYVDERNELFTYTPDRLVLLLRDAPDLRSDGDTIIGGERHVVVRATLHGDLPVTVAFHAGTGLPALLRFRQGHPNDFGLVPFGNMQVAVWYSNWQTFGSISIPTQWDIERASAPYKRMTVQRATFDPEFAADSFAVAPDLRAAFIATRAPMHDRAIDSVTVAAPGLLQIHAFGFPAGAVQVGNAWVLLEAGHASLNLDRARTELRAHGVDSITAAVVVAARNGNGGIARLVRDGVPVYTSGAEDPFFDVMLAGADVARSGVTVVTEGRWLEVGGARLRLEPIDLPDVPGSLLIHSPEHAWVYAPDAVTPLDVRMVRDIARERGWTVTAIGTARTFFAGS